MKKIMLSLGLMLGALTLTNCSNEIDENINTNTDGVAFELTAAIDANRTVANGFKTTWAANDAINLFHAVAGETTYTDNASFAIAEEDLANGRFVGTLGGELTAEAYDWYAFYPYSKYVHSPKGEDPTKDYYQIWSQTQSVVANSTAHVVGKNGPLYGVVKNVVAGEPVKVQMHQLGTLLRVKVGNESGEDFIINSIKVAAAKSSLTSSFLVDLTGESGAVIPCEGYAKQDVTLNVTGEYTIADGDDASDHCFYAAVAPFTAPEGGETLAITVVTDKGTYETTKDIPAGAEFASGVVNSLVVTVEEIATEELSIIDNTIAPYSVGFESSEGFTATTTYNNPEEKLFGSDGAQWAILCGTATTTGKIKDSQSLQTRYYASVGVSPYMRTNFAVAKAAYISFQATSTGDNCVALSYKAGNNDWIVAETFTLSGTAQTFTYMFNTIAENVQFKFTTVLPESPTDKSRVTLDDVTIGASVEATKLVMSDVATTPGTTSITYAWPSVDNAVAYEFSFDGYEWNEISATTYTRSSLVSGNEYSTWFRAVGDGTLYTTSDAVEVKASTTTESLPEIDATKRYEFKKATTIEAEKWYAFVANDLVAIALTGNYGYLDTVDAVTLTNGNISLPASAAFGFLSAEDGFTIQQYDGKYLYMTDEYNSFNVSTAPASGNLWTASIADDGTARVANVEKSKTIQYSTQYASWGAYSDISNICPTLYELVEVSNAGVITDIALSELTISATAGNTTNTITVYGEGIMEFSTDVAWLSAEWDDNQTITIYAGDNTATNDRTGHITVTYGVSSVVITVTQSASGAVEKAWTLVTDVTTLAVGDQIIIAAKDEDYALSTNQKTNNREAKTIVKSGTTATLTADIQVITLEAGTVSDSWAFNVGNSQYLYAASASKNHLKSSSTKNDNASWTITISSSGVATIKAQGTNTRNWMRYNPNNGAPIFSCYGSGQQDIVIYKYQ